MSVKYFTSQAPLVFSFSWETYRPGTGSKEFRQKILTLFLNGFDDENNLVLVQQWGVLSSAENIYIFNKIIRAECGLQPNPIIAFISEVIGGM